MDDIIYQDHGALFYARRRGFSVQGRESSEVISSTVNFDLAYFNSFLTSLLQLFGYTLGKVRPFGPNTEDEQTIGILALFEDLLAHSTQRPSYLSLIHDTPLRAALVGFVSQFLCLFDRVEDRQFSVL